jgi:inorganic triphosphatase YgiF
MDEIEMKLAVEPAALERIATHPAVTRALGGRFDEQHLASAYYDTPGQALRAAGIAARVREIGGRHIQTVKAPGGEDTGLQQFREYEAEIAGDKLNPELVGDDDLRDLLAELAAGEGLAPVFATEFDRRKALLEHRGAVIELALDKGEIRADGHVRPLCEAELELKSGGAEAIVELALALSEAVPFRLESRTKAARGYALAAARASAPDPGKRIALDDRLGAGAAFTRLAARNFALLRANEAALREGDDPEAVHQLRVSIRRLRALLSAFRPVLRPLVADYLKDELRWLQNALGPARDWDVFLAETLHPITARLGETEEFVALQYAAEARRAAHYRDARTLLDERRYTRLLLYVMLWLNSGDWIAPEAGGAGMAATTPVRDFARGVLRKRAKRVNRLGRRLAALDEHELHELRIRAKKLRYAIEFFASLFERKKAKAARAAVVDIQDRLGALNDAVVSDRLLAEIAEHAAPLPAADRALIESASAQVRAWQAGRIHADLAHLNEVWAEYARLKPFWKG